jgi:regulator of cell morphogenesis and NO signaling
MERKNFSFDDYKNSFNLNDMLRAPKEITPDLSVADIVTDNYRTAEVFRKYHIDYRCNGKMSLNAACILKGLHEPDILEELQQFADAYQYAEQWSVGFMIDYLINIHHNYFKNNIPVVLDYINRFTANHNKKFPEIQQLPSLARQLCDKLADLASYESDKLFPYIKRIIYAYNNNEVYGKLFIKTLGKLSAEELEQYHAQIKVFTSQIEHLANNFSLPENACSTHRVMLQKLREFIDYIGQHFSIEKKILIPAILQMEKSLLEKIY